MTDIAMASNAGVQDRTRLQRTLILAVLGALGAASFYFSNFPVPEEYKDLISEDSMRVRAMIGPMLMVGIGLLLGHFFAPKAGIKAPMLDAALKGGNVITVFKSQIKPAVICALIYGAVVGLPGYFVEASLTPEVAAQLNSFSNGNVHVLTKLLYGSLAEEIVMRWGLLALILWGAQKVLRKASSQAAVWTALIIGASLTTLVHAPAIYKAVENPPMALVALVVGGNFLSAILAGNVVIKKGLEAGMMFKFIFLASALSLTALVG